MVSETHTKMVSAIDSDDSLSWTWKEEQEKPIRAAADGRVRVGIFDSGVGGLTVYKELKNRRPDIDVVYFADMARQPYGPRTQEQVASFSQEILSFLRREGCGAGIIACNTATAATYDYAINQNECFNDFPVLGTIPFAAQAAKKAGRRVGVIATQGTVSSGAYSRALAGNDTDSIIEMPCPEFMPLVEAGEVDSPNAKARAEEYMAPCGGGEKIDTLIYGCTHYPVLAPVVTKVLAGKNVTLIDPAVGLVDAILEKLPKKKGKGTTRFTCNADPQAFAARAARVLGYDVSNKCELVSLEEQQQEVMAFIVPESEGGLAPTCLVILPRAALLARKAKERQQKDKARHFHRKTRATNQRRRRLVEKRMGNVGKSRRL